MTLMYNENTVRQFQHQFGIHDWVGLNQNKNVDFFIFKPFFQYKFFNKLLPIENKIREDEEIILTDFKFILDDVYSLLKKTPNR